MRTIRRRMGVKIFLSYLAVILVGALTLATTAEFAVPSAFDQHLRSMQGSMTGHRMGMLPVELEEEFYTSFRSSVTQAVGTAALAAVVVAGIASLLVSRRVVAPVRQMMQASQRIAEGRYEERVAVPGNPATGELDELGELALHFNQMADRLDQTEAMRRQLIGDVAHELRTPLTTIKGYMEGLMDGMLPGEVETYQLVYREADRLGRLVEDLQELSRVEAQAFDLHLKAVSVAKLVDTVVNRLAHQYNEKGVELEADISSTLPHAWADEDRIGQVLLNLAGNALQYTPSGGKVSITALETGGEIRISVSDTGEGISAEHLPHLFTRFYRVDKSRARARGGSGIGLTIARHLVVAHGGRIWAESQGLGSGSRFTFTLPTAPS